MNQPDRPSRAIPASTVAAASKAPASRARSGVQQGTAATMGRNALPECHHAASSACFTPEQNDIPVHTAGQHRIMCRNNQRFSGRQMHRRLCGDFICGRHIEVRRRLIRQNQASSSVSAAARAKASLRISPPESPEPPSPIGAYARERLRRLEAPQYQVPHPTFARVDLRPAQRDIVKYCSRRNICGFCPTQAMLVA